METAIFPQVSSKILRRQRSPIEYEIYKAGLEWDLEDPIVIENSGDVRSEVLWRDRVEPYQHQVENLITFCRRLPVTLLADDVGLGKTISAGLIMSELIARHRISKILIICPKLLGPQWEEELREKFGIASKVVTGRDLTRIQPEGNGAVISTYHSARLHLADIPEDRFEMLILDEAHKLRNLYGVDQPPQVAQRFREALEERRFRYVLMLTATPIQNRLWDLYSLVDLLTVARGHENPFGSEGMFERRFIDDDRSSARRLNPDSRNEFREIVYGYMSRVRRADANLYFPDRVVQMHRVTPTTDEQKLVRLVGEGIQGLNKLAQISVLQALVSSPDAVRAQLNNMAVNGTFDATTAKNVDRLVDNSGPCAKISGLRKLIETLSAENPKTWRVVVFTTRRETQTTIESVLSHGGLSVGCINGDSGARNQQTLADFRSNPPKIHVIVSTEAGSEGINLQVANVLVNFDLPWNPMVVEQRIGRVQRLASEHKSVAIFNITLAGTFEEYIVGRLMEKLQMASHAIGDVESLLEGSGLGEEGKGFEERIRELVVQALAGKDIEKATQQAEESILQAKETLERESKEIDSLLGSASGKEYVGPRTPTLPVVERTMGLADFVLSALAMDGAEITERSQGVYRIQRGTSREYVHFDTELGEKLGRSELYHSSAPKFLRLVREITASGVFDIQDLDTEYASRVREISSKWTSTFDAPLTDVQFDSCARRFSGEVLALVRATVAHDSYERLVSVVCDPEQHSTAFGEEGLRSIADLLEEPSTLGVNFEQLYRDALDDPGVAEFRRFYLERRSDELKMAGVDERKQKKLADEFTPKVSMTIAGIKGELARDIHARLSFDLDGVGYFAPCTVRPSSGEVVKGPEIRICEISGKQAPSDCFARCSVTGKSVLRHLLEASEESGRLALHEKMVVCAVSRKRVLPSECGISVVTGESVLMSHLLKCEVSGSLAEEAHMGKCDFTNATVLIRELEKSQVSGKIFRKDQRCASVVSGESGHNSEFVKCEETQQLVLESELDTCAVTGKRVIENILEECEETGKRMLPAELGRCADTGRSVIKSLLVASSISGDEILKSNSLVSATGDYCGRKEAIVCLWSGKQFHPGDMDICSLTGLRIAKELMEPEIGTFGPLIEMLAGIRRTANCGDEWPRIASLLSPILDNAKCEMEAAVASRDTDLVACVAKVKQFFGLRTKIVGFFYDRSDESIFGEVAEGRRDRGSWVRLGK